MPTPAKPAAPGLFDSPLKNFSASIVVFLVALPLCMGIAIASGVPVSAGIITGIVGGLVVGFLAGAPLQVSGPAAGLTVIVYEIVREHGVETLGLCVLLGGVVQIACGLAKFGVWFRAVSPAVIRGMLTGIGVLIFASQAHVLVDDAPPGGGLQNLATIPRAVQKGLPWPVLRPEGERADQVALLKASGALHERQEIFREEIAAVVPTDYDPSLDEADSDYALAVAAALAEVADGAADRQAAIAAELADLRARFREAGLDAGRKSERRRDAAAAASDAVVAAVAALRTAADPDPVAAVAARRAVDAAEDGLLAFERSLKNHDVAAKLGLLAIGVIVVWQLLATKVKPLKFLNVIPAPLVAVLAAGAAAWAFVLPVVYVEVPDNLLSEIRLPTLTLLRGVDWGAVVSGGLLIGAVASAESLLCAAAVDKLHGGVRANFDRELFAQGVGNAICGALGALPMTGVIVRSSANVRSGATGRSSAIMHGAWLLIFAAFLGALLALIPTTALAGVLVLVGWKLMDFAALKELWRVGKGEVAVFLTTVLGIVCFDLLSGVIAGIVLAAVRLLVKFGKLHVESETDEPVGDVRPIHHLRLRGAATFLKLPKLAEALEDVPPRHRRAGGPDPAELHRPRLRRVAGRMAEPARADRRHAGDRLGHFARAVPQGRRPHRRRPQAPPRPARLPHQPRRRDAARGGRNGGAHRVRRARPDRPHRPGRNGPARGGVDALGRGRATVACGPPPAAPPRSRPCPARPPARSLRSPPVSRSPRWAWRSPGAAGPDRPRLRPRSSTRPMPPPTPPRNGRSRRRRRGRSCTSNTASRRRPKPRWRPPSPKPAVAATRLPPSRSSATPKTACEPSPRPTRTSRSRR